MRSLADDDGPRLAGPVPSGAATDRVFTTHANTRLQCIADKRRAGARARERPAARHRRLNYSRRGAADFYPRPSRG